MHAIVIDDLAVDRQIVARILQHAGWTVDTAPTARDGLRMIEHAVRERATAEIVVITDLDMPEDPLLSGTAGDATAGAHLALLLRSRMEHGTLPRLPVIALTGLSQREVMTTARAFGCDSVISKPASLALGDQIEAVCMKIRSGENETLGVDPLLGLLRARLAEAIGIAAMQVGPLAEHDITRALLAYKRTGLVGLGSSTLATSIAPHLPSPLARGEHVYALLTRSVQEVMRLGADEAHRILHAELVDQATPATQSTSMHMSLSEYYRRRREAILVLLKVMTT